jgi:hypothetical protein
MSFPMALITMANERLAPELLIKEVSVLERVSGA